MQAFLLALRGSGELVVTAEPPALDDETKAALVEHDALYRLDLPLAPPPLDVETAYWAAKKLHEACHFLVERDAEAEALREALTATDGPTASTPAAHYASDLALQYLPSLYRLAERVAREDPLLEALAALGSDWPLSSVGMPRVACDAARLTFLDDPCLRRLYVDRIIETKDTSRLDDERVKTHLRFALGGYPELAPELSETLSP